jgi:hypothetical protein
MSLMFVPQTQGKKYDEHSLVACEEDDKQF